MGCCNSKNQDSTNSRIGRWRSTGIVAMRDSKLKAFPSDVLSIDKFVRTLDLTNNKIVEIPPEIGVLVNMQRMVVAYNLIERLPINMGNLKSLKVLTLDGNRITSLPDELGSLTKLEKLSITHNSLTCLPKTTGDLRNFNSSEVVKKNLSSLVQEAKKGKKFSFILLKLLILNVSYNKLKSFPESIGGCVSLEELQADENIIDNLPSSICNITPLKSISMNKNNLHQLPEKLLKDCKALQNVSLHDNPILLHQFQQMEGYEQFEDRRRKKFDKQIDAKVIMSSNGLDEGVDRHHI